MIPFLNPSRPSPSRPTMPPRIGPSYHMTRGYEAIVSPSSVGGFVLSWRTPAGETHTYPDFFGTRRAAIDCFFDRIVDKAHA